MQNSFYSYFKYLYFTDFKFDEIHGKSMVIDIEKLENKITDCKNESAIVDCLKELEALDTEKFALTAENINKILKKKTENHFYTLL